MAKKNKIYPTPLLYTINYGGIGKKFPIIIEGLQQKNQSHTISQRVISSKKGIAPVDKGKEQIRILLTYYNYLAVS